MLHRDALAAAEPHLPDRRQGFNLLRKLSSPRPPRLNILLPVVGQLLTSVFEQLPDFLHPDRLGEERVVGTGGDPSDDQRINFTVTYAKGLGLRRERADPSPSLISTRNSWKSNSVASTVINGAAID